MNTVYLEDLRKKSGKSIREVLDGVRAVAPTICPSERSGVINWEQQGILDFRVISALSKVYGLPADTVGAAAAASKSRFQQRQSDKVTKKVTNCLTSSY